MPYTQNEWSDGDSVTSAKLNNLESGVTAVGYEPTTWQAGDVVTAEKLNHLEQGVADSVDEFMNYLKRDITEFTITLDMFQYQDPSDPHWDGYTEEEIEEYKLEYRSLSTSLNFNGCTKLETIHGLELIAYFVNPYSFTGTTALSRIDLPNAKYIGDSTGQPVFGGTYAESISLDSATSVNDGSVNGAYKLKYLYMPSVRGLKNACQGLSALKKVYIGAGCTSINASCFGGSGANNGAGLVIDCGFAEGAVSGAPWAATNATINYNVPDPGSIDAMIEGESNT